ncbi:MAG: tetratricopeptide repeat protein [Deltaproteobacteria bacterium]|nr:tetratricopeptide repeat protein [Deltaproteobacteria bacterium]
MSYINDALHKVQKEKESPYAPYGDVLQAQSEKPVPGKKAIFIAGFVVLLCCAAGLAAWFYWPDSPPSSRMAGPAHPPDTLAARPAPGPPVAVIPKPPVDAPPATLAVPPRPVAAQRASAPAEVSPLTAKEKSRNAATPEPHPQALAEPGPADAGKLYTQALQAQRAGRLEEAKELYKKVIQKEPRHLQALNNLGVVYLKMKRYKWAIRRFNDALAVKRDYADAHYNLACLYAQKNDTKQSMFYLKNAVDSNPEVRQWAGRDEDLKNLAGLPEFGSIIKERDQ